MKVETYNLKAANGRHIKKATKVTMFDGTIVRFMDKLGKKDAMKQAIAYIKRENSPPDEPRKGM